jgi:hypothetical protein
MHAMDPADVISDRVALRCWMLCRRGAYVLPKQSNSAARREGTMRVYGHRQQEIGVIKSSPHADHRGGHRLALLSELKRERKT